MTCPQRTFCQQMSSLQSFRGHTESSGCSATSLALWSSSLHLVTTEFTIPSPNSKAPKKFFIIPEAWIQIKIIFSWKRKCSRYSFPVAGFVQGLTYLTASLSLSPCINKHSVPSLLDHPVQPWAAPAGLWELLRSRDDLRPLPPGPRGLGPALAAPARSPPRHLRGRVRGNDDWLL